MIPLSKIEKLKINWGEKADSLEVMAEVRIYNTSPNWECYIYALNPENNDEFQGIWNSANGIDVQLIDCWSLQALSEHYNSEGEYPKIDSDFRPRLASEIYKQVRKNEKYRY